MNNRIIPAGVIAACLFLAAAPAGAEGGWWQKGADWLESLSGEGATSGPAAGEVANAFRQALRMGTRNVVQRLGSEDGFYADPEVRIPLPDKLQRVKRALDTVGMAGMVEDLELKLNRAAETATPRARAIFIDAIGSMTFDDIMAIYRGSEDAATRYFQNAMTPGLSAEMRPIVEDSLSQVGAIQSYDNVIDRYRELPFVPDMKADISDHVLEKTLAGIFHYVAREEAAIRSDPARHTTELLKKVFGAD